MGWYRWAGRPLFFALPPESAHRLAGFLLRLPLPWGSVGGVTGHAALETNLAGVPLSNPVGLAAGFDKSARSLRGLSELGFGYVVVGTVTRRLRSGNPRPRIVRRREVRSLVNAMGLPNRGAVYAADRLRGFGGTTPILASLADEGLEEVLESHALLEPFVRGFELNASCPNVSWGRDRDDEEHLRRLLRELGARRSTPLFVKLPPFDTPAEREAVIALAGVAAEAGADGLTCSNSRPVAEPRLASGRGGLSGRALSDATPRIVADVRGAIGRSLPINACGGVFTATDALACIDAGATTVQVYTGLIYEGPRILREITTGLAGALAGRRVTPDRTAGFPQQG